MPGAGFGWSLDLPAEDVLVVARAAEAKTFHLVGELLCGTVALYKENVRKKLQACIELLRRQAAKAEEDDFDRMSSEIATLGASLPEILKPPRLWAQDITPEKLAEGGERMAILSDEGGMFEILG